MNDYSKSSIYIVKHKDDVNNENCYIGSSRDFHKRQIKHKSNCYNTKCKDYKMKVYQYIRSNGGLDNFIFEEIYKFSCNNKYELKGVERQLIKEYNATLNSYIPNRTQKEYYIDNIARISARNKQYYNKNKDKFKEINKENYLKNIEKLSCKCVCTICGSSVRKDYMTKHIKRASCKSADISLK